MEGNFLPEILALQPSLAPPSKNMQDMKLLRHCDSLLPFVILVPSVKKIFCLDDHFSTPLQPRSLRSPHQVSSPPAAAPHQEDKGLPPARRMKVSMAAISILLILLITCALGRKAEFSSRECNTLWSFQPSPCGERSRSKLAGDIRKRGSKRRSGVFFNCFFPCPPGPVPTME